jgi:polyisoprenyl-phosphate glycosyltransferase
LRESSTTFQTTVSVVVPVYSGVNYLEELVYSCHKLREAWSGCSAPICLQEVIFVNDNAIDGSPRMLQGLSSKFSWIKVIHLSRNFGQHPATIAGILNTTGDWVVTMDEDLQHSPTTIPAMLKAAVYESMDIVYAGPSGSVHSQKYRNLTSQVVKVIVGVLAGDRTTTKFNSFRLIRGQIARAASAMCGPETYFDVALSWFSKRVAVLQTDMQDRRSIEGEESSGYTLRKLLSHTRRLVLSSRIKHLRLGGYVGLTAMFFGISFAAYVVFREITHPGEFGAVGWASLIVTVLIFNGMLAAMLAVILEYLSVLTLREQGRPVFFIVDRSKDEKLLLYFKSSGGSLNQS